MKDTVGLDDKSFGTKYSLSKVHDEATTTPPNRAHARFREALRKCPAVLHVSASELKERVLWLCRILDVDFPTVKEMVLKTSRLLVEKKEALELRAALLVEVIQIISNNIDSICYQNTVNNDNNSNIESTLNSISQIMLSDIDDLSQRLDSIARRREIAVAAAPVLTYATSISARALYSIHQLQKLEDNKKDGLLAYNNALEITSMMASNTAVFIEDFSEFLQGKYNQLQSKNYTLTNNHSNNHNEGGNLAHDFSLESMAKSYSNYLQHCIKHLESSDVNDLNKINKNTIEYITTNNIEFMNEDVKKDDHNNNLETAKINSNDSNIIAIAEENERRLCGVINSQWIPSQIVRENNVNTTDGHDIIPAGFNKAAIKLARRVVNAYVDVLNLE